ncbi:7637_t:CDS:1, partial [Funneliformis caledonium]
MEARTIPTSEMTAPSIIQWPENTTRSLICNVDIITDYEQGYENSRRLLREGYTIRNLNTYERMFFNEIVDEF